MLEPDILKYSCNFVPEVVAKKVMNIRVIYISEMPPDGLTKPLSLVSFKRFISQIIFMKGGSFSSYPCGSEPRDDY